MFAAQAGHAGIVQLLAPAEHGLLEETDGCALGKTIIDGQNYPGQRAAAALLWEYADERDALGGNLEKILRARLHVGQPLPCSCGGASSSLLAAAEENCLCCCERFAWQAGLQAKETGESALMRAAGAGAAQAVQYLFSAEAELTDRALRSALMYAARVGCGECVRLLMAKQRGLRDAVGQTALSLAANAGLDKTTLHNVSKYLWPYEEERLPLTPAQKKLFEDDFKPPELPATPCSCKGLSDTLLAAAERGCCRCCYKFFSQTGMRGWDQQTSLMNAAFFNHVDCLKFLIQTEARRTEGTQWTALMLATQEGNPEAVKELAPLESGMKDVDGEVAIAQTLLEGYDVEKQQRCAELLWEYPAERAGLSLETKALLMKRFKLKEPAAAKVPEKKAGNDSAQCPTCGKELTSAIEAAKAGCPECCKRLAQEAEHKPEVAAVVEAVDAEGMTGLHHAALADNPACIEALLPLLAGKTDMAGRTALMAAAVQGNVAAVKVLAPAEKGARAGRQTALVLTALGDQHSPGQAACAEFLASISEEKDNLNEEDLQLLRNAYPRLFPAPHCNCRARNLITAAAKGCLVCCERYKKEVGQMDANGRTALMRAAAMGHLDAVKFLVVAEAGMTDAKGETGLMLAAAGGYLEVVKLLAEKEAGTKAAEGQTALMKAIQAGQTGCAEYLLDKEAGAQTRAGLSALMMAVQAGQIELAKRLIPKEGGLETQRGQTALMFCAQTSRFELAELLMDREAGEESEEGRTALMEAAGAGDVEMVRLLLPLEGGGGKGAECATLMTLKGKGPMEGRKACAQLLLEAPDERERLDEASLERVCQYFGLLAPRMAAEKCLCGAALPETLHDAAVRNCVVCCKRLLAQANGRDAAGKTALMRAAEVGSLSVLSLLARVEAGLLVTGSSTDAGKTALHLAVDARRLEALRPLLGREALATTALGDTALLLAVKDSWAPGARVLARKEGRRVDAAGMTALMLCAKADDLECATAVVEAEKGVQRANGYTALMVACRFGARRTTRFLADYEARIARPDGWTALMTAARYGSGACAELLVSKEAGMRLPSGATALMIAAQFGAPDCVRALLQAEKGLRANDGSVALRKTLVAGASATGLKAVAQILWMVPEERQAVDQAARKRLKEKFLF